MTPVAITNRPSLPALAYRMGTYTTFFTTMKAALSSRDYPALAALRTRETDDPAIAMLDAWAVVADVLTFYQERIANEGYLRTATEQQSVMDLAQLVGYTFRPGVSASVYLAYTADPSTVPASTIPAGSRVQSQAATQGALPQAFETEADLSAQADWNNLTPRKTQPQVITKETTDFYVSGTSTNLKPNDAIVIAASDPVFLRVAGVEQQFAPPMPVNVHNNGRTHVVVRSTEPVATAKTDTSVKTSDDVDRTASGSLAATSVGMLKALMVAPAAHPASALDLRRSVSQAFAPGSDATPAMLATLHPLLETQLYAGLSNTNVAAAPGKVYALRVQASPFGSSAPPKPVLNSAGAVIGTKDWPIAGSTAVTLVIAAPASSISRGTSEDVKSDSQAGAQGLRSLEVFASWRDVTVSITVDGGSTSATRTFTLPQKEGDDQLGKWTAKLEEGKGQLSAVLSPSLPTFKIAIEKGAETLSVTADANTVVQARAGQSASAKSNGEEITVSAVSEIVIDYESANAPDAMTLSLDSVYDQIVPGSLVAIDRGEGKKAQVVTVTNARRTVLAMYNQSNKVTQLTLDKPWLDPATDRMLAAVRQTTIAAQSEELVMAQQPVTEDLAGGTIELDDMYSGLDAGRWMIVQGERTDTPTTGVNGTELVMLAGVQQGVKQIPVPTQAPAGTTSPATGATTPSDAGSRTPPVCDAASPPDKDTASSGSAMPTPTPTPAPAPTTQPLPGDTTHSFLNLAQPLSYSYKRDSVKIYGNVVRATHGESRSEVLGSGDGSQSMQQFKLHYPHVTHVPASTPGGAQSTLQVNVNDIPWRQVDTLASAGPSDRVYTTQTDSAGITTVQFGDGIHGMRLPTGAANVRAVYRSGLGTPGNVDSGKINMLGTRPLGVKSVVNPLPSTAGADKETMEQGRSNAPFATASLDRLVSIEDYAAYALTFAAIGKADATQLSDGRSQIVYVTVAGSEGTVLDETSEPFVNLAESLADVGDPHLPLQVGVAEFLLLVIAAQVQLLDGYDWDDVVPNITTALLAAFSFDARGLGQSVYLSEVISTMQQVEGVAYVLVTTLDKVSETDTEDAALLAAALTRITTRPPQQTLRVHRAMGSASGRLGVLQPAQVAYLDPDLPDTLILTEVAHEHHA